MLVLVFTGMLTKQDFFIKEFPASMEGAFLITDARDTFSVTVV
jgi:hypothetical protein